MSTIARTDAFDIDVLVCPKCQGRLRVLGEVRDVAMVRRVRESLGLPAETPRRARARDSTTLFADVDETDLMNGFEGVERRTDCVGGDQPRRPC